MKNLSILILLFSTKLNISDQKQIKYDNNKVDLIDKDFFINKEVVTEKYFNYEKNNDDDESDPGNPDNDAIIERPCAFFDRFCIRKFFAQHSNCKIVPGPVKEPFYYPETQVYVVNANVTITVTDNLFTGLNGRIDEFYINKKTGNLVLSVFFEGVKAESTPAYLRFFRNGQEPVEVRAFAAIDYEKMTITTVIPNYKNLRLEDAEINGYLDDPLPPIIILPKTLNIADPTALAETAALLSDIPTAAIENLPTVAPLFANIFIQKNICDFGVPLRKL